MGHMEMAQNTDDSTYYLLHHSVFKSNSLTEIERVSIHCDPSNVILWSNSAIVMSWINSNKPLKSSNRIAQILDLTRPSQWRHIPTTSNSVDVILRGCSAESLLSNELW
ncbi:Hypothetical protein CINCED_3A020358 [Cinara cedri]|uniref:Uncharacterized protein n=1 Tax=Cinara cedri TaxID=506608 RepID=A0A5E4MQH7_9HEMI|nr:Hypothetical protein CINCED_3A020358 [Cinara cedri]